MFSVSEIKELMEKMQETGLGYLEIEGPEFSVKIEGAKKCASDQTVIPQSTQCTTADTSIEELVPNINATIEGDIVRSPIVGTFYEAAAPNEAPFASLGSHVKKGDVLFVIESMKLMNEIQSEYDGIVLEINVSNGQAVEYNQPIMRIG